MSINQAWSDVQGSWYDEGGETAPRVKAVQCKNPVCGFWFRPEHGRLATHCTADCKRAHAKRVAAAARGERPKPSRPGKQSYQVTPEQAAEVIRLRAAGVKSRAIAQRYGVTRDYVSKLCCGIIHGDQTSALRAELRPVKARAK